MVASDTKKIIVIKNISSNLIEEAILILKSEPGTQKGSHPAHVQNKNFVAGNDFILKEAERIINEYISENRLARTKNKRGVWNRRLFENKAFINTLINLLLIAAVAFLIFTAGRAF